MTERSKVNKWAFLEYVRSFIMCTLRQDFKLLFSLNEKNNWLANLINCTIVTSHVFLCFLVLHLFACFTIFEFTTHPDTRFYETTWYFEKSSVNVHWFLVENFLANSAFSLCTIYSYTTQNWIIKTYLWTFLECFRYFKA